MEKLAKNLIFYRKSRGLLQKEVAKAMRLAPQTYANYERNVSEPDCATLVELARFYGISLSQLLGDVRDYMIISKEQYRLLVDAKGESERVNRNLSKVIGEIVGNENVQINGDNNSVSINSPGGKGEKG